MLKEFKAFALRGNVMDMAIGVIIGTAFGKIISSLVSDILMPPIGALLDNVDFTNIFWSLSGEKFTSLVDAQAAGAATINIRPVHQHVNRFHHHRPRPLPGLETDQ